MGQGSTDYIGQVCVLLSSGDITKRDEILWNYTPGECESYIEFKEREIVFRESFIGLMVAFGFQDPQHSSKRILKAKKNQGIGEYCKGADVEECTKYFGKDVLKRVCASCPN